MCPFPWTQSAGLTGRPALPSEDPTPPPGKEILILLFVLQGSVPSGKARSSASEMETEGGSALAADLLIGWRRGPEPVGPTCSCGPWGLLWNPAHPPSSAQFHSTLQTEMGTAMSIQVTFYGGAKLSSLGPGLQQRTPKTPTGHSTRVSKQKVHLGPTGEQAFPFFFRGKLELSKTRPTRQLSGCYTVQKLNPISPLPRTVLGKTFPNIRT